MLSLGFIVTLSFGVNIQDAQTAFKNGDFESAYKILNELANKGDVTAKYGLGDMYYNGFAVKQDYNKAFEWYEKAANQGLAAAQYNLGYMYENGFSVKQDYKKAIEWYEK